MAKILHGLDQTLYEHELGHIKSGHCLYHMMAQILPVIGSVVGAATLGIGEQDEKGIYY